MAIGISPALPLSYDDVDGFYVLTKTFAQNAKQNFKNLILTSPGERVMQPDFGVGIKRYLLENNTLEVRTGISESIEMQVKKYMPFIVVRELEFFETNNSGEYSQILKVGITYSISGRAIVDTLNIS